MLIHLGYEVGTGKPVEIPLAHTFVTGQTQLSGKTSTLQAIVSRAGQPALAFVTKRGEQFPGRRIPPYLPREGEKPLAWPLVESIVASALGERKLKWERIGIINATKGAKSLRQVRDNVTRLLEKATRGNHDMYTLIGEYLDLILPEMETINAHDRLELNDGLNVMDLSGIGEQLQGLIIRACLERINQHESGILTILPEAWQFVPRTRAAPAKQEAINMARKGAAPGVRNYLLVDSQDISGVETVVRQACSLWIIGVQRELNELKRASSMIPAAVKKLKPEDVSTLEIGQFWVCHGREAIKTYVQPIWLEADEAIAVAKGSAPLPKAPAIKPEAPQSQYSQGIDRMLERFERSTNELKKRLDLIEQRVNDLDHRTRHEIRRGPSPEREQAVDKLVKELRKDPAVQAARSALVTAKYRDVDDEYTRRPGDMFRPNQIILDEAALMPDEALLAQQNGEHGEYDMADFETFYQRTKERLQAEGLLGGRVAVAPKEYVLKQFQQEQVDRILGLMASLTEWQKQVLKYVEAKDGRLTKKDIFKAILGRDPQGGSGQTDRYNAIEELCTTGILRREASYIHPNLAKYISETLASYDSTEEEVEQVVGQVLLHLQEN